ncbi:hypothetical protein DSO57_1018999 [Entomophthora muscae]|uniref:Uncharacterized protein n=1 Tax=Entomophthora muscae TaxID=34485 RepID=A0ACC2RIT1_9FUNG|nr:hypothetical protein DSO57_1018999 [Entomophthora muscae]
MGFDLSWVRKFNRHPVSRWTAAICRMFCVVEDLDLSSRAPFILKGALIQAQLPEPYQRKTTPPASILA